MTRDGNHRTFLSVSHNTVIKAGASKEFGFTTTGLGQPFNCTLNGNPSVKRAAQHLLVGQSAVSMALGAAARPLPG